MLISRVKVLHNLVYSTNKVGGIVLGLNVTLASTAVVHRLEVSDYR
jgi:hypothetical protein